MTSLAKILGTEVVSRADAERLGQIQGAVVDVGARSVVAWQVGKGRKAVVADHAKFTGIGDAAAVIDSGDSLRPAESPLEHAGVSLIGSLVLSEAGDALGKVTDAEVDTASGAISVVLTDTVQIPAEFLAGLGTYALVVRLPPPAPTAPTPA